MIETTGQAAPGAAAVAAAPAALAVFPVCLLPEA